MNVPRISAAFSALTVAACGGSGLPPCLPSGQFEHCRSLHPIADVVSRLGLAVVALGAGAFIAGIIMEKRRVWVPGLGLMLLAALAITVAAVSKWGVIR